MIQKPKSNTPDLNYATFIELAPGNDLIESLFLTKERTLELIDQIDSKLSDYQYEKDKWTIKQVLKHISDTERIHAYRALRFSRGDQTDLPGFNENEYAQVDNSIHLSLEQIKNEFIAVRNATIELYKNLNLNSIDTIGTGNKMEFTPRKIGWIISGHNTHHCTIIKERYLS